MYIGAFDTLYSVHVLAVPEQEERAQHRGELQEEPGAGHDDEVDVGGGLPRPDHAELLLGCEHVHRDLEKHGERVEYAFFIKFHRIFITIIDFHP